MNLLFFSFFVFLFSLEYTDVCSQNYSKSLRIPETWQKELKVIPT